MTAAAEALRTADPVFATAVRVAPAATILDRRLSIPGPFKLHHGGVLASVDVAYRLEGAAGAPVVAALGGISADRHVATDDAGGDGWWSELFGDGRAVDTAARRVLAIDFLGGNGQTTGPRSARDGAVASLGGAAAFPSYTAFPAFPDVSTFDQARILATVLDQLRITRLAGFVGASYGGMVALAFARLFPQRCARFVVISAAHQPAPLATALRTIQRRVLAYAAAQGDAATGLSLARALAMTTYRTQDELLQRFAAPRCETDAHDPDDSAVWGYLAARGDDYVRRMHPAAFTTLSRSIDLHTIDAAQLGGAPLTVASVRQDQCVPPALCHALAQAAGSSCELVELDSLFGHDAFLKEPAFFSALLRRCL